MVLCMATTLSPPAASHPGIPRDVSAGQLNRNDSAQAVRRSQPLDVDGAGFQWRPGSAPVAFDPRPCRKTSGHPTSAGRGEHRGWGWIGFGVIALGAYGFVATLQPDAHFGRILAAYGGVCVAGSLLWGMAADGLVGVALIMYAPRR